MKRALCFLVAALIPVCFTTASVKMFLCGLDVQGTAFLVLAVVTVPRWR